MGAIFPGSKEQGFADISAMDVAGFLHRVIHAVPFRAALALRLAIWLVALAPLLVLGRPSTISRLALPDREALISRLVASKAYAIRSLVMILKTMAALLYAADAGVRARMRAPSSAKTLVTLKIKPIRAV
jgi:hypothetical protein